MPQIFLNLSMLTWDETHIKKKPLLTKQTILYSNIYWSQKL